jgi:hypothetical protein
VSPLDAQYSAEWDLALSSKIRQIASLSIDDPISEVQRALILSCKSGTQRTANGRRRFWIRTQCKNKEVQKVIRANWPKPHKKQLKAKAAFTSTGPKLLLALPEIKSAPRPDLPSRWIIVSASNARLEFLEGEDHTGLYPRVDLLVYPIGRKKKSEYTEEMYNHINSLKAEQKQRCFQSVLGVEYDRLDDLDSLIHLAPLYCQIHPTLPSLRCCSTEKCIHFMLPHFYVPAIVQTVI